MSQIPMIAEQRQNHNGVGLMVGQAFLANSEAEAADLIAVRAARRAPAAKAPVVQRSVAPVQTRTMAAQDAEPAQSTAADEQSSPATPAVDPAEARAAREAEARANINRPGQHQRRDMRARR